jgi:hypothetical protein
MTFIPIIEMTASSADWQYYTYSGTPLTMNNPIEALWQKSSQGIPAIICPRCNLENLASSDQHAMKMIGKNGVICAGCGGSLQDTLNEHNPARVTYRHRIPGRRHTFAGFQLPQIVHPIHYNDKRKWADIISKRENWSPNQFMNEVMGESYDDARMPITASELVAACEYAKQWGNDNDLQNALQKTNQFQLLVMGIDWSGGGDNGSTTCVAVGGLRGGDGTGDRVDIIYMERIPVHYAEMDEVARVTELIDLFKPARVAHDYGGAGASKETLLRQAGVPSDLLVPFTYSYQPTQHIIHYQQAQQGRRSSYLIDKTRSILLTFTATRQGKVHFPLSDKVWQFLEDLLQIRAERRESPRRNDMVCLLRKGKMPDDMAHALNFLCCACWYMSGAFPQMFGAETSAPSEEEILQDINPPELDLGIWGSPQAGL